MYNPTEPNNNMQKLPLALDFKSPELLIQLNKTNIALARLDEVSDRIPNKRILIEFVSIKEGVNSNEIENIRTTIEDAFVAELIQNRQSITKEEKETLRYKDAIIYGFETIKEKGIFTVNDIVELNKILLENNQGILSSPSKYIMSGNDIIYTPPQGMDLIKNLLADLEKYYNVFDEEKEIDPLLKLPMLHYQFEAIHPFGDGNGRVGRILAVLFLVLHKKLKYPILFLSERILYDKKSYYEYLHKIDSAEESILHHFTLRLLRLIERQALKTMSTILRIEIMMLKTKNRIKSNPKLVKRYSHELIDYLFTRPYYSIEGLQKALHMHRHTASSYFHLLEEIGIVKGFKMGNRKYYFNEEFLHELKYGGVENKK